jgi:transcriptional regulator with XRE-family HTH domain
MIQFQKVLERFGNNLKKLRNRLNWTQMETSRKAGIAERRYQEIEAGRANITLRSLFRLSQVFRKGPKDLL